MNKYEDIINLQRPKSKKHPPMSLNNRLAQFAPFSALTGYEEKIKETARVTTPKIELTEEEKLKINNKISWLKERETPEITITYFIEDERKKGGRYQKITGKIKRIDEVEKQLFLMDKTKISIEKIINIESNIFEDML